MTHDPAQRQAALDALFLADCQRKVKAASLTTRLEEAEVFLPLSDLARLIALAEDGALSRQAALKSQARGCVTFAGITGDGDLRAHVSFTSEESLRAAGAFLMRDVALIAAPDEEEITILGSNSTPGDRR